MDVQCEELLRMIAAAVSRVQNESGGPGAIPLGISNRHIHLSQQDLEKLLGAIEKVRVLGPVRKQTQVEILAGDTFKLGVKGEVRMSGVLGGTPGITLIGPKGSVQIPEGVMIAQRHIHMSPLDALILRVSHGDRVSVAIEGDERGLIFNNVAVRVSPDMRLEMHIDTDEANAAGADSPQAFARLVGPR